MKPLIVIPVFNEAAAIATVVAGARAHGPVVVVDDGSTDGSGEAAARAGAEVLRHPRRLGKAQAIRSGIVLARQRGATAVVTLDGDGQHDPAHLPALLAAAREAPRAIVVGGRLEDARHLPPDRLNAIRIAGFFVNWASGLGLRDTQSGYRVYPRALLEGLRSRRGGFVFETEVLLEGAARGFEIEEVPVRALPRVGQRSRFRPLADGAAIALFLSGCVLARWAAEARAATGEVASVFRRERLQARHAAMYEAAAPYADSPGYGLAIGAAATRRLGDRLGTWWRHPRLRRAARAAVATAAVPPALGLVLLQSLAGRWMADLATPLVTALYTPDPPHPRAEAVMVRADAFGGHAAPPR